MKIVIINAVYGKMSTGRTYKELHDTLCLEGHSCKVIYGQGTTNEKDCIYIGNYFDHKLHALLARITGKIGCYSYIPTLKLINFLKNYKPDIVHLGNLHSNFVNIPMLLKYLYKNNIATTVTLHDCFFFTGGCVHYTLNKCNKWQSECKKCKEFRNMNSWLFDRSNYLFKYKKKSFNKISRLGVIGVSNWISSEARSSSIFKGIKHITTIYNWVDLDIFKPQQNDIKLKLGITDKKMILGVASRWSNEKGLQDFIKMAKFLGDRFRIVLVGNILCTEKLPKNIINIPPTDSANDLAKYYSAADVFVQLSLEETFGKVVAESLACGTPAVVYNSTASPELVKDGCGAVVNIEDGIEGIITSIKEVCINGKDNYIDLCRRRAENSFNKDINIHNYIEFWQKISKEMAGE